MEDCVGGDVAFDVDALLALVSCSQPVRSFFAENDFVGAEVRGFAAADTVSFCSVRAQRRA